MNNDTPFLRRLGPAPTVAENSCAGCNACPDIWELDNGDFAVIGEDITAESARLPASAGCAPHERIVRIPRQTLVFAKSDIPDRL